MATFKVLAGDFGDGKTGQVLVGRLYRESGRGLRMPIPGQIFKTEHIKKGQIEALEIATDENLKRMGGSIGWGLAGSVVAGPIGALAGVLAGGNQKNLMFICKFKDGRRFLGSCDAKTYTAIQSAAFVSAVPTVATKARTAVAAFALLSLLIVVGMILWAVNSGPARESAAPSANLDQAAVELIGNLVVDDITEVLLKGKQPITSTRTEDLLGWIKLDWQIPAKAYEAAYDSNEIDADNNFKGKKILISGAVVSIGKDFAEDGYVTLRGSGLFGVDARLSKDGMTTAASLIRGEQVNLVCAGSGRTVTVATLEDCDAFGEYLTRLSPTVRSRISQFLSGELSLRRPVAVPLTTMYVAALSLPKSSPCFSGVTQVCRNEIRVLMADKARSQAVQAQAAQMVNSLKIEPQ